MLSSLHWSAQKLGMLDCGLEPCARTKTESRIWARAIRRHRDDSFQDPEDYSMLPILGLRSLFEDKAARSRRAGLSWACNRFRTCSRQKAGWQQRFSSY